MPRIGPFKGLGFNSPTPQTEDLYIKSINKTTDDYRVLLEEVRAGKLVLPNRNLDDGKSTEAGEYSLADDTYADLLAKLTAHNFDKTSTQLRDNILGFYAGATLPAETQKDSTRRQEVLADLSQLKAATPAPAVADKPANPKP